MEFQTKLNHKFVSLNFAATIFALTYLAFRIHDFSRFYMFMEGRYFRWVDFFRVGFPLLVLGVDLYFVVEQILFNFVNFKYKLPSTTPELKNGTLEKFPFITVLIPTCGEPWDVLRKTVEACTRIDYPKQSFEILVLDDRGDSKIRTHIGTLARYESRVSENLSQEGFKAGNLNFGVRKARSETQAFLLLDADQACESHILKSFVPYLYKDGSLDPSFGFVQAPQTYQMGEIDLWDRPCREFHFVTQSYRAYRNATMFTGTSAMVGNTAIEAIGLFDERSVTEDILTGAKIQAAGFHGDYHPTPVAYGLVPMSHSDLLRQRLRWSQGAFQLIRFGRPFAAQLSWEQRLTYLFGIFYFLMGFPFLLLAALPAIILHFKLDASLDYSNASIISLLLFIGFRHFARDSYCPKVLREKAMGAVLGIVYSPVYLYAFFSALIKKKIRFWTTPKDATRPPSRDALDFFFSGSRWALGLLNLTAILRILILGSRYDYPLSSFLTDYGGILFLSFYFMICSFIPSFLPIE
jgi:cellulose synthase (UDP-forming)